MQVLKKQSESTEWSTSDSYTISCHHDPLLDKKKKWWKPCCNYFIFYPLIVFLFQVCLSLSLLPIYPHNPLNSLINSDEIRRRATSQRCSEGNKHFQGKSNKVKAGRQWESPTSGLCPGCNPGCTTVTSVPCFHLACWHASRGLVTYSDHFSPLTPPRAICIHNEQLPKEAIPALLCHPAYINSVQGMQWLSGERGGCSVG